MPGSVRLALLGVGLIGAAVPGGAAAAEPGCMERHLLEAAALNEARLPLYAALTGGRSERVSRRLIRLERMGLPVARRVDRLALRFQDRGIPIVCAEFVEMADTPPFRERVSPPPAPPAGWRVPSPSGTRAAVLRAHRRGGFPAITDELHRRLTHLEAAPGRWCMTRHLLESAARIAQLAPSHVAAARAARLPTPLSISADLLDLHLMLLGEAARMDRMALSMQEVGVPILCADVPPIPYD